MTACLSPLGRYNTGTIVQTPMNILHLFLTALGDAKSHRKMLADHVSSRGPFSKGDVFFMLVEGR